MSSIKDVAKMAGVSISTVSRVINNTANVREDLKIRVLKAVKNLKYRSNPLARGLKGWPTRTIGLIIPDIENPFFPAMVRGVQDVANKNGYAIFLCNTDGDTDLEEAQFSLLLEKKVDGILLVTSMLNTPFLKEKLSLPVVLIDRYVEFSKLSYVVVDHTLGMNLILDHLRNIGRQKAVFLGSKPVTSGARERFQIFMKHYSKEPKMKSRVFFGKYTEKSGFDMAKKLLKSGIKFDSVVCGNDLIAFGVLKAFEKERINVPNEVSVVGYDDISFSIYHFPKITTIHQPVYEMGEIASHLIIDAIEKGYSEPKHIKLEPRLVIRETSIPRSMKNVNS